MDLLWTIAIILVILWALGLVTSYTLGGFVHILLVLAIIVVLIRVIQGRARYRLGPSVGASHANATSPHSDR